MIARGSRKRSVAWVVGSALSAAAALGQAPKRGLEFQVNSYTPDQQEQAAVAMDADGDFVVVWESLLQDGNSDGVFAQRFSSAGARAGVEFQVSAYTTGPTIGTGIQDQPDIVAKANGDFLVVWRTFTVDGSSYGVFGRRYDSAGVALATEFQINDYTTGHQSSPAVAIDDDGDFVVVWQSFLQDRSQYGVFARRFDSLGTPQAPEFQVNSFTLNGQYETTVAMGSDGRFVVAWKSTSQDGAGTFGVFARPYDSAGTPLAAEFQVNTYTVNHQAHAVAAFDPEGGFLIVWDSGTQDGGSNGVFAQRFASSGSPIAVEFQINAHTLGNQYNPSVAIRSDGDFLLVWSSGSQDPNTGIFARRFASSGAPLGFEFQINTYTPGAQTRPALAMDDEGNFVVAWESAFQDGAVEGIVAQRFGGAFATLDVDANAKFEPLTDALLILRYAFGFSGSTLVGGAVGGGCTRCTAPEIDTYLDSIVDQLDVDDNGSFQPLTDALLILRYGFGFTGSTLTTGAVGPGCMRCDAPTIEAYLAGLIG